MQSCSALPIPAIQKIREAANRIACASNLRQIGLAAHSYVSAFDRLPPGYIGPMRNESFDTERTYNGIWLPPPFNNIYIYHGDNNQWVGHFPLLLPYLEAEQVANQMSINLDVHAQTRPWWILEGKTTNRGSSTRRVKTT